MILATVGLCVFPFLHSCVRLSFLCVVALLRVGGKRHVGSLDFHVPFYFGKENPDTRSSFISHAFLRIFLHFPTGYMYHGTNHGRSIQPTRATTNPPPPLLCRRSPYRRTVPAGQSRETECMILTLTVNSPLTCAFNPAPLLHLFWRRLGLGLECCVLWCPSSTLCQDRRPG